MHRLRVVCAVMVILVGLAVGLVVEAVLALCCRGE